MMNCNKCGNAPQETDKIAWKCTSCGKVYGVKLLYLQKIQEKKNSDGSASLLKCKECGVPLDNGDEKIFWKCSCGNVQSGRLGEYSLQVITLNSDKRICNKCKKALTNNIDTKFCPYCGKKLYNTKKNNRIGRKNIVGILLIAILAGAITYGVIYRITVVPQKRKSEMIAKSISEINTAINQLQESGIPSQAEYDKIVEKYSSLAEADREKVLNYGFIEEYSDVDLKIVNDVTTKINNIDAKTKFSTIIEIEKLYDNLTDKEKNIVDLTKLEKVKKLSNTEMAALSAAKNVKSCMKSESSFVIKRICVKNDLKKMNFYWVLIEYSGSNSFGANIDNTSCFGISSDFKDPFFPLAHITGIEKYLNGTTSYLEYIKCKKKIHEIDVEKIQYYL